MLPGIYTHTYTCASTEVGFEMPDGSPDHIQCNYEGPEPHRQVREEVCSLWLSVELTGSPPKHLFGLNAVSKLSETPDHAAVLCLLVTLGLRVFPSHLVKVTWSLMSLLGPRQLGSACQGILSFSHSQRKRSHWGCANTWSFPCHQLLERWARARWQDAA